MDPNKINRIEYENQYFGVSSDLVLKSYKDIMQFIIEGRLNEAFMKAIRGKLINSTADPKGLDLAVEEVIESLVSDSSKGIEFGISAIENKVQDCFHIPEDLCLKEDAIAEEMESVDPEKLKQEIEELKERLKNATFTEKKVRDELTKVGEAIKILERNTAEDFVPVPDV